MEAAVGISFNTFFYEKFYLEVKVLAIGLRVFAL